MRFLVEKTDFALESVWSLSIEWKAWKCGSKLGKFGLCLEVSWRFWSQAAAYLDRYTTLCISTGKLTGYFYGSVWYGKSCRWVCVCLAIPSRRNGLSGALCRVSRAIFRLAERDMATHAVRLENIYLFLMTEVKASCQGNFVFWVTQIN